MGPPRLRRVSTSESRRSSRSSTSPTLPDPPAYEETESRLARLRISPREEEGSEQLPGYSCSLSNEAVFRLKMEFLTPFEQAITRKWDRVYVVLNGTQLSVHHLKEPSMFSRGRHKESGDLDRPAGVSAGRLIKKYTLQHAEVGVAADYNKRAFVLRLRVEAEQFLLSSVRIETMVEWLDCLSAAIDLALPLDDRRHPDERQPPPRRRRAAGPQRLLAEQLDIIRELYPHLSGDTAATAIAESSTAAASEVVTAALADDLTDGAPLSRVSSEPSLDESSSVYEDDIDSADEKWHPHHAEEPPLTRRYARRYMGGILIDSRRKTPWVIHKGRRYYVNWGETRLTPWKKTDPVNAEEVEPPSYDSASKESRQEELALARIASAAANGWRPGMIERI